MLYRLETDRFVMETGIGFLECVKCSVHANRTKTLVKATEKQMKSLSVALCSGFMKKCFPLLTKLTTSTASTLQPSVFTSQQQLPAAQVHNWTRAVILSPQRTVIGPVTFWPAENSSDGRTINVVTRGHGYLTDTSHSLETTPGVRFLFHLLPTNTWKVQQRNPF